MNRDNAQGEKRVIIAGGGTGGHLFPGIAVADELRRRLGNVQVLFVGTERGIESRVVPARGDTLELLNVTPLKGRGPGQMLASLARLPLAIQQARAMIQRFGADLVIGVGGYAAGPVLAAASTLGVPCALLEQNARTGLTNRLMSRFVGRAYLSFEETASEFGASARVLGNPVRPELVTLAQRAAADPEGFEARALGVLVVGGSQGARALNDTAPSAIARALKGRTDIKVVHQTGESAQERVAAQYAELGIEAVVVPFISDMASAYASAAVVVARAGATTLAELAALGRPSILIPYPFAADDHQTKNARAFEQAGASICVPQDELNEERLAGSLSEVLGDAGRRESMAHAARGLGRPEAAAAIVDDISEWLNWQLVSPSASPTRASRPSAAISLDSSAAALVDEDDDKSFRSPRLRGFGAYEPTIRRRASERAPRRRLLFEENFAWD